MKHERKEYLMKSGFLDSPYRSVAAIRSRRMPRLYTLVLLLALGFIHPQLVHGDGQFYVINNPTSSTATMDVSADGSVAVGVTEGVAWSWSLSGGYQALTPPDFQNTFHAAISADGLTVVSI